MLLMLRSTCALRSRGQIWMEHCRRRLTRELARCASSVPVKLSYSVFESKKNEKVAFLPPLILLHGLFGSKKNFESIAKTLSLTGHKVITVDSRNHGDSPHSSEMNYHAMSGDVELLLRDLNIESAIVLGHSMGGKTAMTLALTKPHLIDMLIVEDISPAQSHFTEFPEYIAAMKKVAFDPSVKTLPDARKMAEKQLLVTFPDKSLRAFILTNIHEKDGTICWRINLESIDKQLKELISFPHFSTTFTRKTIFIGGKNSPQISSSDNPEINRLFPKAVVRHIEGAGHWTHSDKPHEFIDLVKGYLNEFVADETKF